VIAAWEWNANNQAIIQVATRSPSGVWSDPQTVSRPSQIAHGPSLAVDARGNALLAWSSSASLNRAAIDVASLTAGASRWSKPTRLSATDGYTYAAEVAVGRGGAAAVVWLYAPSNDRAQPLVQAATRAQGERRWHRWRTVGQQGTAADWTARHDRPHVVIDAGSRALIVWQAPHGDTGTIKYRWQAPRASSWRRAQVITGGQSGFFPAVATSPNGSVAVVWEGSDGSHTTVLMVRRSRSVTGWGAPVTVSTPGADCLDPDVVVDGQGSALIAWDRFASQEDGPLVQKRSGYLIQAAEVRAGSNAATSPSTLSNRGNNSGNVQLALAPHGGLAVWQEPESGEILIRTATYVAMRKRNH
jgi:hypothetical protein